MLIIKWLIMTASVMIAAYVIPGITVNSFFSALWVAVSWYCQFTLEAFSYPDNPSNQCFDFRTIYLCNQWIYHWLHW